MTTWSTVSVTPSQGTINSMNKRIVSLSNTILSKSKTRSTVMWLMFAIQEFRRKRQIDLCDFKTNRAHIAGSTKARAAQ